MFAFVGIPLPQRRCASAQILLSKNCSFFNRANYHVKLRRPAVLPDAISMSDNGVSFPNELDGTNYRIGIVSTRWNIEYVQPMVETVKSKLKELKVSDANIVQMQVPGSYELPIATRLMCAAQKVDAVICIGALIRGETDHYQYIANAVSTGIMDLQLTLSIPLVFGVLTCQTEEQARARSIGEKSNAKEWAFTAVEMAALRASQIGGVSAGKKSVGFF